MVTYKSYYWNTIFLDLSFFNTGSTKLLDINNNEVGKLLIELTSNNIQPNEVINEKFTFVLYNKGSIGFSVGLDNEGISNIRNGIYGKVSDYTGAYTNSNMTYYFEYLEKDNLWKITFKENKI